MAANDFLTDREFLGDDAVRKYFERRPEAAESFRKANAAYRIFGEYLNLTQSRIIVRESGGSTSEAELSATLLRTDR
jgi:hypothetical protein